MVRSKTARFVVDTNVVFEGLTQRGGAPGLLIDAWLSGILEVFTSNALIYEYEDVLTRKLSPTRWVELQPVLGKLLTRSQFVVIHYSWRPMAPDPGDEHVIDCAMNAGAAVVTSNIRDYRLAQQTIGLVVLTPVQALHELANSKK